LLFKRLNFKRVTLLRKGGSHCVCVCARAQRSGQRLPSYAVYDEDACTTNHYELRVINDSLHLLTFSLNSLDLTPCIYYAGNVSYRLLRAMKLPF